MARVDLKKTVYNKDQFNRVTGGVEFKTFITGDSIQAFSVEDFFNEYENLFLNIPANGETNSHEYLARRSSEISGFQKTNEDIQPLLDEIASLRRQLLQSRQDNINLQIAAAGGSTSSNITDQLNEVLAALQEEGDATATTTDSDEDLGTLTAVNDSFTYRVEKGASPTSTTYNVVSNDIDSRIRPVSLISVDPISSRGSTVQLVDGRTVSYTPLPDANGLDVFTYTIENIDGQRATGRVEVRIANANVSIPRAGSGEGSNTQETTDGRISPTGDDRLNGGNNGTNRDITFD